MTDWKAIARGSPDDALVKILQSSFPPEAIYEAGAELERRSVPDLYPRLTKWRSEMAAGLRDAYTFDELWRAACEDANRRERDILFAGSLRQSNPAEWQDE